MKGRFLKILGLLAVMLAVLYLFTHPLWSSRQLLYQGDVLCSDVTELNFPSRFLLAEYLKHGKLPIWNPLIGCGFPALMEGQGGIIYPLNLLLYTVFSPVAAFNASVILSLLLALVFSYFLCRLYDISQPSSLFAAISFTFSGFVMAKLKFSYMLNSICWLPLAVYGVEKAFKRSKLTYLLLTATALSLQLLAGGPQIFFITASLVLFVFLWRLANVVAEIRKGETSRVFSKAINALLKSLAALAVCILIAAALAAPQLIPQIKGLPYSDRSGSGDFLWSFGASMRPENLAQFFTPFPHGNPARGATKLQSEFFWENISYPGLLCTLLALVALLFLTRRKADTVLLWLVAALLALAISLGTYLPLAQWLWKYIPGFKMFRYWQRYLVVSVLAVAVLAGLGMDFLLTRIKGGRTWRWLIIILLFSVLLTDLGLFAHNQLSTLDAERMLERNRTAMILKDLLSEDMDNYRIAVIGQRELWKAVMKQAGGWLGDKELFYQYMELVPPNHNILFGLSAFNQYGDYGLADFKVLDMLVHWIFVRKEGWRAKVPGSVINLMRLSSVKYLLTPFELDVDERYREVTRIPLDIRGVSIRIYELNDVKPRAYLTTDYRVIPDMGYLSHLQILETLTDSEETLKNVVLNEEPSIRYRPGATGEVRSARYDATRIVLEVSAPEGGILVLNDSYYPEWEVRVNGEKREQLKVNYVFRGVELGPGSNLVEFSLSSTPLIQGSLILAFAFLLILLILLEARKSASFGLLS